MDYTTSQTFGNPALHTFFFRDGMLKLDDQESIDGHSLGALRSLDLDQPTYVGGVPYAEHSKLVNRTALMHLLGVQKLVGLDGCIKRFKLGHREVKIQSASEPLALRRISLNECQEPENPCEHYSCQNGGVCHALLGTAQCQCKR